MRINLNNDWKYKNHFTEDMLLNSYNDQEWEIVRIPHTNKETPYHYFDEMEYQFVCCYRKNLVIEKSWSEKKVILNFDGVLHLAKVYVNNKLVTIHHGGYTSFHVDISQYLDFSDEAILNHKNVLVVEADSRETNNLPPFGNVIDYLTYGGIYREVYLEIKEKIFFTDAFVTTVEVVNNSNSIDKEPILYRVKVQAKLSEQSEKPITIKYLLQKSSSCEKPLEKHAEKVNRKIEVLEKEFQFEFNVTDIELWDVDNPVLYDLKMKLEVKDDDITDEKTVKFGFRNCRFEKNGFFLNGKKIKLIGLNRHQSFPYVGYAMPKRMQRRDADILKYELGVNAVRTSHYPQSQHFIDRCDEIGLLVFTEIPGWQYIGNEEWKEIACNQLQEMIIQYRNHPSIILWGVRINESQDDDSFYSKTNQIAHELDSSRQTGGVRFFAKSNLLEDVYTFNDFSHNGKTPGVEKINKISSKKTAPYLVTEFNGHMYPTKAFDDEEHRLNLALRHACVLDGLFEQENIAGGFGWCMFDYNTHKDFGSGDRICYHGMMDMFRNPKLAASVYASQNHKKVVCEISSSMDIGDHQAGSIGDVYLFTNADSVRIYKNNEFVKEEFPDNKKYPNLPHPPIIMSDFVGGLLEEKEGYSHKTAERLKKVLFAIVKYGQNKLPIKYKMKMLYLMLMEKISIQDGVRLFYEYIGNWGGTVTTYHFDVIKNNQLVWRIIKKPWTKPKMNVFTETLHLKEEETYDVAAIRIMATDENNNRLSYFNSPVIFEATGVIELIGPSIVSFSGGYTGTFIKTKGLRGEGVLKISQETLGSEVLVFQVE